MSEDSINIGVGTIVRNSCGQILLGYRVKKGETPSWCLPGGHIEAGETFEQAAIREIKEETGLCSYMQPQCLGIIQDMTSKFLSLTVACTLTLGDSDLEPRVTEPQIFKEWQWFSFSSLPHPLFPYTEAVIALWKKQFVTKRWNFYSFDIC